jgi:hypothetical protein
MLPHSQSNGLRLPGRRKSSSAAKCGGSRYDPPQTAHASRESPIDPYKRADQYRCVLRYQTEVESWRELQSQNIEFTMKRLREPVEAGG